MRRLPPLNALRAFEAAARHESFKAAAAELGVTPAAVGHQIRALEAQLGVALFRRFNRAVETTPAGLRLRPGLSAGLDQMAAAVADIAPRHEDRILTISVAPTLAARWLVPRLDDFYERHADITVRFDTAFHLVDFQREGVDLAVRFCAGPEPGQHGDLLFPERVGPVCSPSLLSDAAIPGALGAARGQRLLQVEGESADRTWPDWPALLGAAGGGAAESREIVSFGQSNALITAALAGHGVALAPLMCVLDELAQGRLVRPFGAAHDVATAFGYYLVCPEHRAGDAKVATFRAWLLREAERHGARFAALSAGAPCS